MKEYTLTKKSTNESIKAKSLTELSKASGIKRSILARFYRMSKNNKISKSENMADYEPITKKIILKQIKTYGLVNENRDEIQYFNKKKDIAKHLNINEYQLNKILNGTDKSHEIIIEYKDF